MQESLFPSPDPYPGELEEALRARGIRRVIGVDEAGRGPLAGPVHAAAYFLDLQDELPLALHRLDDSKKLDEATREELFETLQSQQARFAVASSTPEEIDEINILQATFRAMTRAVEELVAGLDEPAELVVVDGNLRVPTIDLPQRPVVGGDGRSHAIAAASVLAKVSRDRLMREADRTYPGYGFAQHKGYGTAQHRQAIRELGPCPLHRRSFAGVLVDRE